MTTIDREQPSSRIEAAGATAGDSERQPWTYVHRREETALEFHSRVIQRSVEAKNCHELCPTRKKMAYGIRPTGP